MATRRSIQIEAFNGWVALASGCRAIDEQTSLGNDLLAGFQISLDLDEIAMNVLALPGRTLSARINYVAAAIDPATRRLLVRATLDNKDGLLKPEMFANVTIYSAGDHPAVGVPKQALIYEGNQVRVWVAHEDKSIELRQIKTGLTNGDLVEVEGNLKPGEQIVTKGSLFIDRAASGS